MIQRHRKQQEPRRIAKAWRVMSSLILSAAATCQTFSYSFAQAPAKYEDLVSHMRDGMSVYVSYECITPPWRSTLSLTRSRFQMSRTLEYCPLLLLPLQVVSSNEVLAEAYGFSDEQVRDAKRIAKEYQSKLLKARDRFPTASEMCHQTGLAHSEQWGKGTDLQQYIAAIERLSEELESEIEDVLDSEQVASLEQIDACITLSTLDPRSVISQLGEFGAERLTPRERKAVEDQLPKLKKIADSYSFLLEDPALVQGVLDGWLAPVIGEEKMTNLNTRIKRIGFERFPVLLLYDLREHENSALAEGPERLEIPHKKWTV